MTNLIYWKQRGLVIISNMFMIKRDFCCISCIHLQQRWQSAELFLHLFLGGDLVMRFCDDWYTSASLIFFIQILLSAITAATTVQNGLQNVRGRGPGSEPRTNRGCICDLGFSLLSKVDLWGWGSAMYYLSRRMAFSTSSCDTSILAAVKRPLHLLKYGVEMI